MKTSLFALFAMLTQLLSLWMSAAAFADNSKVYNGAACIVYGLIGNLDPAHSDINFYQADGSIKNDLPENSLLVLCPIVRDNTTNTDGLRNVTVRVFIPVGQVAYCSPTSRGPFGQTTDAFRQDLFSSGSGNQSLEFKDQQRLTRSFPLGPYDLFCILPPGGILFSYFVTEP
jgi:hypothetical protein